MRGAEGRGGPVPEGSRRFQKVPDGSSRLHGSPSPALQGSSCGNTSEKGQKAPEGQSRRENWCEAAGRGVKAEEERGAGAAAQPCWLAGAPSPEQGKMEEGEGLCGGDGGKERSGVGVGGEVLFELPLTTQIYFNCQ